MEEFTEEISYEMDLLITEETYTVKVLNKMVGEESKYSVKVQTGANGRRIITIHEYGTGKMVELDRSNGIMTLIKEHLKIKFED